MMDTDKKRRSTFAVLFYINRTKIRKDGLCQLLCKISIDGKAAQIGTKVLLDPNLWDPAAGRATGRSRNALEINRSIDRLTTDIQAHYNHIRTELGFVSAALVKNAVQDIAQKPRTLLALFREHNEEFGKRVGIDRTAESHASYVYSYNHLAAFLQQKYGSEDIPLHHLDANFYDAFDLYLRADCGMMQKTVHGHLYHLKKMTRRAVSQGTLRYDPYNKLHPALPARRSRHMKLEDLKRLMEKPTGRPNLDRVRDWFLFSTFTGLAYADLKRLSEKDITRSDDGTYWLHIRRQKTDTLSVVRLLDIPLRIIEKYRHERKSDKIFNLYCRDYIIKLTKKLGMFYGIGDLTFHKARHNFGTHITLSMGVPIESVSQMMGHKNIATTQIYAKVTDKKVDEDMQKVRCRNEYDTLIPGQKYNNNLNPDR